MTRWPFGTALREWAGRLRDTVRPRRGDSDLEAELRSHLDLAADEALRRTGATERDVRDAALRAGGVAQTVERLRDRRGVPWLMDLARDLRHAARTLRRSPSFTICAVLTLALAIGANTAMFTLADAILFRPLPVPAAQRLLRIDSTEASDAARQSRPVNAVVIDAVRAAQIFTGVCGFQTPLLTADIQGSVASVSAVVASGDCFQTLGVHPALGRLLEPADDLDGAPRVIVISYDAWQQDFGGRPDVLDQFIGIDGERCRIVGVVERAFPGLLLGFPARIYSPLRQIKLPPGLSYRSLGQALFARLRDGDSVAAATARLETEWPAWMAASIPFTLSGTERARYLARRPLIASAATGIDYSMRPRFERPLTALLVIASLVLLVAAVNVANLLLARAADRRRDTAVRLALGATRWHVAQRVLLESGIVLGVASAAGIVIAYWCDRLLVAMFRATSPGFELNVTPDARTLGFAAAAASLAFLVFALGPALRSADVDMVAFQSASARTTGEHGQARRIVLVAQVALTLVLVAVGGVFVDALSSLRQGTLGIDPNGLLTVQLAELPGGYVNGAGPASYYRTLIERMRAIPGVASVTLSADPPYGMVPRATDVTIAGGRSAINAQELIVTDRFFETMHVSLVAGDDFRPADSAQTDGTVIISESLARKLFGSDNPLGRWISAGTRPELQWLPELQRLRIVAVARDAVFSRPQDHNTLIVYRNWWQAPILVPTVVMRTRVEPTSIAPAVRDELRRARREYPRRIRTVNETLDGALAQERLLASLSAAFSALGLALAAVGLYGLLAFTVATRTNEIAVRMALGASRQGILRLIVGDTVMMLGVGIAIGAPLAWLAVRAAAHALVDTHPSAMTPIASAVMLLMVIGVLASAAPALRAVAVNPMDALRGD